MKASQTETVIMLTCCALQSACYSPTGIVISFILAQFQGEVQTNLTVKRFLMCSAALCTSIAEELFIISRLSRSAERSKRIFTGRVVEGKWQVLRRFLRKRGAAGEHCQSVPSSGATRHLPPTGGRLQRQRYSFRLKRKACGRACAPLGELSRSD